MTAFLVLVGVALLVGGGAMYFAHAARNDPRWIAGSLLFPFVVPLYYRRHWEELHVAALVQSAGLVLIVAGACIGMARTTVPDGLVSTARGEAFSSTLGEQHSGFVDSERALELMVRNKRTRDVSGRLRGESFVPERVELIDGVLRLSQGGGFFPDLEIAIDFGEESMEVNGRFKRAVAPDSPDAPRVFLMWRDAEGHPETDIFHRGYRLEVELTPVSNGRLAGHLQITLPDAAESFASGEFVALTNHLRYRGDEVDRKFDHEDTLRFVGEEFLATQHPGTDVIDHIEFSGLRMDSLEGTGEGVAVVLLTDGREARHLLKFSRSDFGWYVAVPETLAATEAAGYAPVYRVMPEQDARPRAPQRRVESARAGAETVREVPFTELGAYAGRGAEVEYRSGRREQGVLKGLRRGRLVLESIMAGGVVQYQLTASEIAAIRLTSGEVLRLSGAATAPATSRTGSSSTTGSTPAAAQSLPLVAGVDPAPLLNRNVRVTARDGKVTTGVLRGVNTRNRLVVETLVGGGKVDYTVPVDQVVSMEPAGR